MSTTGTVGRERRRSTSGGEPPVSWESVISDSQRFVLFCIVAMHLPIALAVLVGAPLRPSELGLITWLGILLLLSAQAVIIVTTARRSRTPWQVPVVAGATMLGLVLATPGKTAQAHTAGVVVPPWWPAPLLVTTLVYLCANDQQRGWLLAATMTVVNAGMRSLTWPDDASTAVGLADIVLSHTMQLLAMTAAAQVAVTSTLAAAHATNRARERANAVRIAADRARHRHAADREADRLVHDEVLHGLLAVSLAPDLADSDGQRTAAGAALRLLDGSEAERAPTDTLRDGILAAAADLPVQVTLIGEQAGEPLPAEVVEAVAGATREALRNIAQHAGTDRAVVRLRHRSLATVVSITDTGRGFDTAAQSADPAGRRGVSDSIVRRMSDVGGQARIISKVGEGTRVELIWSPSGLDVQWTKMALGAAPRLLAAVPRFIFPLVVVQAGYAALLAHHLQRPWAVVAATALAMATAGWASWRGMVGRLTGWHAAAVVAIAWSCSAVNAQSLTDDTHHVMFYWLSLGAGLIGSVLSLFRPLRESIICQLGLFAVALATVRSHLESVQVWSALAPSISSPLLLMVLGIGVRRLADRMTESILRTNEATARDLARWDIADAVQQRLQDRLAARSPQLRELFTQVLQADRPGPELRERAALLERLVREDLVLGELPGLREAIAALRAEGCTVTVRVPGGATRATEQAIVAALREVVVTGSAAAPSSLTVRVSVAGAPARVSLLLTTHSAHSSTGDLRLRWVALGWEVTLVDETLHARRTLDGSSETTT
ncbi:MAG TPA: hypothetical protein P5181_07505 [Dermatophilaceae bacterium]|nr:hypothetical protein [Dermatophilaceae bacterium]